VRVLTLVKRYLPGFKSGGPVRSLANLVECLGDEFDFTIVTYDRDTGDQRPYPHVSGNAVQRVGKAEVIYLNAEERHFQNLARIITTRRPDVLYINSFFEKQFGVAPIVLRRLGLLPDVPVILAPRGEFSIGALGLQAATKRAYLMVAKAFGLHRGITWQASSPFEAAEIRRRIASSTGTDSLARRHDAVVVVPVLVAPHLVTQIATPRRRNCPAKAAGYLRVTVLSRLAPVKNLLGALHVLARVRGRVDYTIYGPVDDRRYWLRCQRSISELPSNICVRYAGPVEHTRVADTLAQHDLFFLPTLGENYGHVIMEALMAGCPVLLSDRTPWRDLTAAGVGWDLPLEQPERFADVLEECVAMDGPTFAEWSDRAIAFAAQRATDPAAVEANRGLFRGAIHTHAVTAPAGVAPRAFYDEEGAP
jgi:glycosyltransferase involved in cell wall biosynthesis